MSFQLTQFSLNSTTSSDQQQSESTASKKGSKSPTPDKRVSVALLPQSSKASARSATTEKTQSVTSLTVQPASLTTASPVLNKSPNLLFSVPVLHLPETEASSNNNSPEPSPTIRKDDKTQRVKTVRDLVHRGKQHSSIGIASLPPQFFTQSLTASQTQDLSKMVPTKTARAERSLQGTRGSYHQFLTAGPQPAAAITSNQRTQRKISQSKQTRMG